MLMERRETHTGFCWKGKVVPLHSIKAHRELELLLHSFVTAMLLEASG